VPTTAVSAGPWPGPCGPCRGRRRPASSRRRRPPRCGQRPLPHHRHRPLGWGRHRGGDRAQLLEAGAAGGTGSGVLVCGCGRLAVEEG
jgi:hypothetical protein